MENTSTQTETIKSSRNWVPISWLSTINLQLLIEIMKRSVLWAMGEPCTNILLNNQKKKIVLAVLPKNTEVVSFQSCDSITFRVIEGRLKLKNKNITVFLNNERNLTLIDKEEYTLSNKEETAYLLTMENESNSFNSESGE